MATCKTQDTESSIVSLQSSPGQRDRPERACAASASATVDTDVKVSSPIALGLGNLALHESIAHVSRSEEQQEA